MNVIVFELNGSLTPEDNFIGRSQTDYGLEEVVNLTYTTNPTGVFPSVQWTKLSGVGSVSGTDYLAGDNDGNVTLKLGVTAGPSLGEGPTFERTVVEPSGTRMTRVAPTKVWHIQWLASAGILLYYWLDPKDVSFSNLYFEEGSCTTSGTGCFASLPDHPAYNFGPILDGSISTGCRVAEKDYASLYHSAYGSGGSFTWNIPSQYIDLNLDRWTFDAQTQQGTIQSDGNTITSKEDESDSRALDAVDEEPE